MAFAAYCLNRHTIGIVQNAGPFGDPYRFNELESKERLWDPFCPDCGASVYERCESCRARFAIGANYCRKCGTPAPWTKNALAAADHAVESESNLSAADQSQLKESLPDLTVQTPRTSLALKKAQELAAKGGPMFAQLLFKTLSTVLDGEVKKHLGF